MKGKITYDTIHMIKTKLTEAYMEHKMEKDILSLKSLYRFLVINDYPIYSLGIITEENKKGLTVMKFWQDNLLYEFKSRKYGKTIWRTTGGRNRYLSEICNRSKRLLFYREYAKEIADNADYEICLNQIIKFMEFLKSRQFSYDIFIKKLFALLDNFEEKDSFYTEEIAAFFCEAKKQIKEIEKNGAIGQAFCCSWFLTFLSLHALAGDRMADTEFFRMHSDEGFLLKTMWEMYLQKKEEHREREQVSFLTNKNTELCMAPLPEKNFFGREVELFELRELLRKGGRYLLSGVGGAGKTELLRQLLKDCCDNRLVDVVCTIQYTGSLMDSFVRAFPSITGKDMELNFKEAMGIIRSHGKEQILILIDNMNHTVKEDTALKQLLRLPGTIFVTSRNRVMEGFETYEVKAPSKEAGMLIFRDNYKKILTSEDKQCLEEIFKQDLWCHILTLRLLGKASRAKNWSIRELQEHMKKGDKNLSWEEEGEKNSLPEIYRRMYSVSELHKSQIKLLRIFAVLPYDSYSIEFSTVFLNGFLEENESMEEELDGLTQMGFVEKGEMGYSMHPFVAECMISRSSKEEEYASFFEKVKEKGEQESLWEEGSNEEGKLRILIKSPDEGESIAALENMVVAIADKLKGRISQAFTCQVLEAGTIISSIYGMSSQMHQILKKLMNHCEDTTEEMWIYFYALECQNNFGKIVELEKAIQKLEKERTVSEYLYLEFCCSLGYRMQTEGMWERVETLSRYVLNADSTPNQKIRACRNLGYAYRQKGDVDTMLSWVDKGLEIAEKSGHTFGDIYMYMLEEKSAINVALGRTQEAKAAIIQIEEMTKKQKNLSVSISINFVKGYIESHGGNPEEAVVFLEKAQEGVVYLFERDSYEYIEYTSELALSQNKVGKRKEALANYESVLPIVRAMPGRNFDLLLILNNMAVVYLDWEKPKKALKPLEEAYGLGRQMGGIALAEPANNLSKVWKMLGKPEKELAYLKEAYPLLKKQYGENHKKVVEAEERLKGYESNSH